jgi:hypothetical protein
MVDDPWDQELNATLDLQALTMAMWPLGTVNTYVLFIVAFGLVRHFKTDPTETVALCFVYPKPEAFELMASCLPRADEQAI